MFLTIGGDESALVTIPVAWDGDGEVEGAIPANLGDEGERGPGGMMMATRYGIRNRFPVRTAPMTAEDAAVARAVLESAPPLYCVGEWVEIVTGCYLLPAHVREIRQQQVSTLHGRRVALSFDLLQAGPMECDAPSTPGAWWRGTLDVYEDIPPTVPPLTDEDRIRSWVSEEYGGYTLQQDSGDEEDAPLYAPDGMGNGLHGVNFNARPWMWSEEAGLLDPVSGTDQPWSAIIVTRLPAGSLAERYVFSLRDGGGLSGAMHAIGTTVVGSDLYWNTIRMGDSGGATSSTSFGPIDTSEDQNFVIEYVFDADGAHMWVNGELVLEDALSVGAFNPTALVVGALDDGGAFEWSGQVGEVVYFPGEAIGRVTRMSFAGTFAPYRAA